MFGREPSASLYQSVARLSRLVFLWNTIFPLEFPYIDFYTSVPQIQEKKVLNSYPNGALGCLNVVFCTRPPQRKGTLIACNTYSHLEYCFENIQHKQ